MSVRITKGTIEYLIVNVKDRLGNLTTLAGTSPKCDVREQGATTSWVFQNQSVTLSTDPGQLMTAFCLVDTSSWDVGTYELFLKFDEIPEHPRLGPFVFDVS